jgi:hypothetical protein
MNKKTNLFFITNLNINQSKYNNKNDQNFVYVSQKLSLRMNY